MPWGQFKRRTKDPVLPENESTYEKARVILLTRLVTDEGTAKCGTPISPWLDAHRSVYANVMLDAWSEARKRSALPARSCIGQVPCRVAARHMLDMCSDLRTHVVRQGRSEINGAYGLNYPSSRSLTPSELLEDFTYLLQDPGNPNSPRFMNKSIAAVMARAFYSNGRWGIAAMTGNQEHFKTSSANLIALIGAVLYHAIKEFQDDGKRKTIAFNGHVVEDKYNAIRDKWGKLSPIRRVLIWDALQREIAIHANHSGNGKQTTTVPVDTHDDDIDDLLLNCTQEERQRYDILVADYQSTNLTVKDRSTVQRTDILGKEDTITGQNEDGVCVQVRESSGEVNDISLEEYATADDFTAGCLHEIDEQLWFQNGVGGWSIVTEDTWFEFCEVAEEHETEGRILRAVALTKGEWERDPEECDEIVLAYMADMAKEN
ncbi:hypothetical protein IQ06DRAFT_382881 [Phaeosphaeriaceae sp. SRC1lsM3a]|nr:hypothetical protein IQ06DRAFT_382881 [Stagonospora sp. SRC1lsM3a]